jgi:hypothetical protein
MFQQPSVHPREDLYLQLYGISCTHPHKQYGRWQDTFVTQSAKHILPSTRLLMWMRARNTIQLQVQVFLRMNSWMFETCRRHYN